MGYLRKKLPRVRQQIPGEECCPYGRAVARQTRLKKKKQKLVHVGYGKFVVVDVEE